MAEEKKPTPPEQAAPVAMAAKPVLKPAEEAPKTVEVATKANGINIKIEGDFVEMSMSQYLAEHIGQFRSCDRVVVRFKHGAPPDITAYHTHGNT